MLRPHQFMYGHIRGSYAEGNHVSGRWTTMVWKKKPLFV